MLEMSSRRTQEHFPVFPFSLLHLLFRMFVSAFCFLFTLLQHFQIAPIQHPLMPPCASIEIVSVDIQEVLDLLFL